MKPACALAGSVWKTWNFGLRSWNARPEHRIGRTRVRSLLTRLKRLETVRVVEERNRPLKIEFAYLKLLPPDQP